jgi:hypothetical protein
VGEEVAAPSALGQELFAAVGPDLSEASHLGRSYVRSGVPR